MMMISRSSRKKAGGGASSGDKGVGREGKAEKIMEKRKRIRRKSRWKRSG
jgi:hypothetical protein